MERKSENSTDEISAMLGKLPKIEAPPDFGTRVRARIAARQAGSGESGWFRLFRIAAPVGAVAVILFAVLVFSTDEPSISAVSISQPGAADFLKPIQVPADLGTNSASNSPAERPANRQRAEDMPVPVGRPTKDLSGSRDLAVSESQPKSPKVEIERTRVPGFDGATPIPIADVLSGLGVEVKTIGEKLEIAAIRPNSVAERSGLKRGDLVETIDRIAVTPATVFYKSVNGMTISVIREGSRLEIPLK